MRHTELGGALRETKVSWGGIVTTHPTMPRRAMRQLIGQRGKWEVFYRLRCSSRASVLSSILVLPVREGLAHTSCFLHQTPWRHPCCRQLRCVSSQFGPNTSHRQSPSAAVMKQQHRPVCGWRTDIAGSSKGLCGKTCAQKQAACHLLTRLYFTFSTVSEEPAWAFQDERTKKQEHVQRDEFRSCNMIYWTESRGAAAFCSPSEKQILTDRCLWSLNIPQHKESWKTGLCSSSSLFDPHSLHCTDSRCAVCAHTTPSFKYCYLYVLFIAHHIKWQPHAVLPSNCLMEFVLRRQSTADADMARGRASSLHPTYDGAWASGWRWQ